MPTRFPMSDAIKEYDTFYDPFTMSHVVHMATHFLRHWIPFKLPTCKLFYDVGSHKKYRHVLQFKFMMSDVVGDTFYDIGYHSNCRHVDVGCHSKIPTHFTIQIDDVGCCSYGVVIMSTCFTTLDTVQIADTFYDIGHR